MRRGPDGGEGLAGRPAGVRAGVAEAGHLCEGGRGADCPKGGDQVWDGIVDSGSWHFHFWGKDLQTRKGRKENSGLLDEN